MVDYYYYEARNGYTNDSETLRLCNRCVCNRKTNSQTINVVCNWHVHRKYAVEAPNYTKDFLPEGPVLSGQAIRTPTFRRFARIDSRESIRKKKPIFEALGEIRANRVFSPIRIEIRVSRAHSSLLSIFWKVDSQKRFFFRSENRFAENIRDSHAIPNRESIRANRPTKGLSNSCPV